MGFIVHPYKETIRLNQQHKKREASRSLFFHLLRVRFFDFLVVLTEGSLLDYFFPISMAEPLSPSQVASLRLINRPSSVGTSLTSA